jgi:hypothetical protein
MAELERAGETGLRFEIIVLWLQDGDSYRSTYDKRSRGSGSSRVKTISVVVQRLVMMEFALPVSTGDRSIGFFYQDWSIDNWRFTK